MREIAVPAGMHMLALQVSNQRVIAGIVGNDVKAPGGIGCHSAADVVGERKIQGVSAGGREPNQVHGARMLEKLFDQIGVDLCLTCADQQRETDRLATDDGEVDVMHILEIDEDMMAR